jgi:uncharacterized membrane protein
MNTRTTTALIAASAMAAALGMTVQSSSAQDEAAAPAMEKCYGVAKAGKNDCAAGSHGCAGTSTVDADGASYINLPAGTCEKLATGSLEPKEG